MPRTRKNERVVDSAAPVAFTAEKPLQLPMPPPPPPPKKDSSFLMITRWSGKIDSKNCGELVEKWKKNTLLKGCTPFVGIEDGTTLPEFILSQLKGKSVVYMDYDTKLKEYPSIFDKSGVDFMATCYNIDPRFLEAPKTGSSRPSYAESPCFDPYTFQPTGGVYYFADTPGSRELLEAWNLSIAKNTGKDVNDVLSLVFNIFKFYLPLSYIQLPSEYLSYVENKNAIIEHKDCLPKDTTPPDMYSELTTVNCKEKGGTFYEYLFFDDKIQVSTLAQYLAYVKENGLYDVIPFDKKYKGIPKTNDEYRYKIKSAISEFIQSELKVPLEILDEKYLKDIVSLIKDYKAIKIHTPVKKTENGYVVTDTIVNKHVNVKIGGYLTKKGFVAYDPVVRGGAKTTYSFDFVIEEDVSESEKSVTIPGLVLSTVSEHLNKNRDVFFVPPGESDELLKEKAALKLDFVATNTSDNDRKPKFDVSKPMFFSASNKALCAIIAMCRKPADITEVFGGSHQFLTQIRCFWVHIDNS